MEYKWSHFTNSRELLRECFPEISMYEVSVKEPVKYLEN